MIIRLSKSISILARHISKRKNSPNWQFTLRVPTDLGDRYSTALIRESLETTDERKAILAANRLVGIHEATFAAMRGNSNLTPAQTHMAAQALADKLGPMEVAEGYFSDLFNAHATKLGFFGSGNAKKPGHLDPHLADEMIKEADARQQGDASAACRRARATRTRVGLVRLQAI